MSLMHDKEFRTELRKLAIPFALQHLLTSLVGASDALMLGRLTQEAISAVSLANQVSFVMSLFIFAITGGAGVLVAQYWGKKDYQTVKKLLCMAIRCTLLVSVIFFSLTLIMPERIMGIFTDSQELIAIGADYLRIVCFSYIFSALTSAYLMLMRIDGRAKISVIISAVTVVVDMVADYFLIYGKAGVPKLGANGSAYSTIVVEVIAFVWVVIASYGKGRIHPDLSGLMSFSKVLMKDMLKVSIPMLGSCLSWGLSIAAHSAIMGHLGTDATAAYSVTGVATSLIECVSQGLASGSGVMIGALLGRNDLKKAKEYGRNFWTIAILNGFVNILLLLIVGPLVYTFYVLEPLAKKFLIYMIAYNLLYMFAYSFNTMFTCGVFPAGGDANYDTISVFLATWCFAIPLSLLAFFVFKWPPIVIFMIMCCDEIIKVPFIIPRYRKYIWLKNLTRDEVS